MLTAEQARALKVVHPTKEEIYAVETTIMGAAKKGETSAWYYKRLTPQMKNLLEQHGYTFKEQPDRDGYMVEISWENKVTDLIL